MSPDTFATVSGVHGSAGPYGLPSGPEVDAPWVAAHFADTGTHRGPFLGYAATGRSVSAEEFAFYRVGGGRIAEVWATAFHVELLAQVR
jgi:predicted ester cyclase